MATIFYLMVEPAKLARVDVREYLPAIARAAIESRSPVLPRGLRRAR